MPGGKVKKQVFREGEVIFEEGGPTTTPIR